MYILIYLDKREESIQRPIAQVSAHQRGFSGPVGTVALYMAHSKPMCMDKMNQRVLWRNPR